MLQNKAPSTRSWSEGLSIVALSPRAGSGRGRAVRRGEGRRGGGGVGRGKQTAGPCRLHPVPQRLIPHAPRPNIEPCTAAPGHGRCRAGIRLAVSTRSATCWDHLSAAAPPTARPSTMAGGRRAGRRLASCVQNRLANVAGAGLGQEEYSSHQPSPSPLHTSFSDPRHN